MSNFFKRHVRRIVNLFVPSSTFGSALPSDYVVSPDRPAVPMTYIVRLSRKMSPRLWRLAHPKPKRRPKLTGFLAFLAQLMGPNGIAYPRARSPRPWRPARNMARYSAGSCG